jgi:hypothetical protein
MADWLPYICVAIAVAALVVGFSFNERSLLWRWTIPNRHAPLFITNRRDILLYIPQIYIIYNLRGIATSAWGKKGMPTCHRKPLIIDNYTWLTSPTLDIAHHSTLLHLFPIYSPWFFHRRAPGVDAHLRPSTYFCWELIDPSAPQFSPWVPRWVLLAARLLSLLFFVLLFLIQHFMYPDVEFLRPEWLRYFTNWTWVAFGMTSLLGVGIVIQAMVTREGQAASDPTTRGPDRGIEGSHACAPGSLPREADVEGAHTFNASSTAAGTGTNATGRRWNTWRRAHLVMFELTTTSALFLTVFYYSALVQMQDGEVFFFFSFFLSS